MDPQVSWQGHFMGLIVGIWLAFYFRTEGPKRPKFQYEIEREMGIEPPDLEGIYLERLRQLEEKENELTPETNQKPIQIVYHIRKEESKTNSKIRPNTDEIK
jgi:hypothetical protein